MNKHKMQCVLVLLLLLAPFANISLGQDQRPVHYQYWYCEADSLSVEHPNYYSSVFKMSRRYGDESPGNQIREAWSRYLLEAQGFVSKYEGLWRRFDDGKGLELYSTHCRPFVSEQEAQDKKSHTENGVKLIPEGNGYKMSPGPRDPSNRSRHVETGWVYSGADDD